MARATCTFTNERAITVTDNSIVTNPRIVYDAASKGYKVFWTDGLSGEGRMATLSDLTAKATVGETLKADAVAMGVGDVTKVCRMGRRRPDPRIRCELL